MRVSDHDDPPPDAKVVPFRQPGIIAEVGGLVDETWASLALYGEDLDPEDVTRTLGVQPTKAFRRGERPRPRMRPLAHGLWSLGAEAAAPTSPDQLIQAVLASTAATPDAWASLRSRFDVQLRLAIWTRSWNRGFALETATLAALAARGASLQVSVYADSGDE